MKVRVANDFSSFVPITSGVLQGTILGQFIYSVSTCYLLVDDVKFICLSDSIDGLVEDLWPTCLWTAPWNGN